MSHKIALDRLDFMVVWSVIGRERKHHMTVKLASIKSPPAIHLLPPSASSQASGLNESVSVHVVVQLALKIELPVNDRLQSSVAIAIKTTRA